MKNRDFLKAFGKNKNRRFFDSGFVFFFFVPKNWNGVVLPFDCVLELGSGNWVVESMHGYKIHLRC